MALVMINLDDLRPKLPSLPEIGPKKRKDDRGLELTSDQTDSLLQQIARSRPVGALAKIGSILDTAGGTVRTTLSGRNPLPGVIDPDQRSSGRDLLESYGILGPNQEGFDLGDLAGFAAEIATDPLTYLTLGASAIGKAGKALKAAGALGKMSRVERMTTKVGDIVAKSGKAATEFGDDVVRNLDKPVGGLVGVGLPFREASFTVGHGPTAQKIGGALDKVSGAVRYGNIPGTNYSPGRHFHQAFNADVKGTYTVAGQQAAEDLSRRQRTAESGVRGFVARQTQDLQKIGLGTHEQENSLRQLYEGVRQPANEAETRLVAEKDKLFAGQLAEMQSLGMNRKAFADIAPEIEGEAAGGIKYTPRRASMPRSGTGNVGPFQARDPSAIGRKAPLKGIPGGTVDLKQLFGDKELNELIDRGADLGDVVEAAKAKYGHLIPEYFQKGVSEAGEPIVADRMTALMRLAKRTPRDVRDAGLFGNSTIQDLATGATGGARAIEATRSALDVIGQHAVQATDEGLRTRKFVPVKKVAQQFGIDPTSLSEDVLQKALPSDVAKELLSFHERWQAPEAVSKLGSAIDQYNSLFKAGVLSWPARHVRDLISGLHRNWQAGHVSGARVLPSALEALQISRGGLGSELEKIPVIARTLAERGVEATPENALDVLRELSYAHEVTGPGQSRLAQIAPGSAEGAPVKKIEDIVTSLPGANPPALKDTAAKFAGRAEGTSLKPWDIQGVGGRERTGFGPVAASNDIGYTTDAVNRLAPFLEMLRNGIDPAEAARRVRDAQVDYSSKALTKTEQGLARFVPFYRFAKGNIPSQLRELASHPGGRLAQTFRGLNNARSNDEIVPDYVQDTTGIRIPENVPVVGAGQGGPARYLTGLGLMYEDLGGLIGTGPVDTLRELATNLGPVAKLPIEAVTGVSLFQKGPEGPVRISDQDPLIGRLLANLTGRDEPVPTPELLELAAANSPAARILSTARTATDTRKNLGTKALNTLTGLKFTDVPEKRRDAILRELLNREMVRSGAKTFERVYYPADELAGMSPSQQRAALNSTALQTELAQRAKQRTRP